MTLDHLVSSAVYQAHLLERAVHDAGPWTITVGSQALVADRVLLPTGVQFTVRMEPTEADEAVLSCNGEVLAIRSIEPADHPSVLQWVVEILATVPSR